LLPPLLGSFQWMNWPSRYVYRQQVKPDVSVLLISYAVYAVPVNVFVAAGCYSDSSSTCEADEDVRPHASHESRSYLPQADRSVSSRGSRASQNHNSVIHDSGKPRKTSTKIRSDLEYLSSVQSESAKSDKLSFEAKQVYAELQIISNKLKVKCVNAPNIKVIICWYYNTIHQSTSVKSATHICQMDCVVTFKHHLETSLLLKFLWKHTGTMRLNNQINFLVLVKL